MALIYKIDGVEIGGMGIHVIKSSGLLGRPAMKTRRSVYYADEHGEYIDTKGARYEHREITLECMIVGSAMEMYEGYNSLVGMLMVDGTHRLEVSTSAGSKPLVFEVLSVGDFSVTPDWGVVKSTFSFTLEFVEAKPVKRVFKLIQSEGQSDMSVTMKINTDGVVDVHWGDNKHDLNFVGEGSIEHNYGELSEAVVVLSGEIEKIEYVMFDDVNSEQIWEVL